MENFSDDDDEDYEEREDEKPQVVQVKVGDLTEEEAAKLAKGKLGSNRTFQLFYLET